MKKNSFRQKSRKQGFTSDSLQKTSLVETSSLKKFFFFFLILFIVIVLGIIIGLLLYHPAKILEVYSINATVRITESGAGLNADSDSLNFGKTRPGGTVTRYLDVTLPVDATMQLSASGAIAPYIFFPENNVFIPANQKRHVTIILSVPDDVFLGEYNGTVDIKLLSH